jgi:hypothetical protein
MSPAPSEWKIAQADGARRSKNAGAWTVADLSAAASRTIEKAQEEPAAGGELKDGTN